MEFLDSILNNLDVGLIIYTPDGKIQLFNQHASSILQTTGEGELMTHQNIKDYGKLHQNTPLQEIINQLFRTKEMQRSYAQFSNHGKGTIHVEYKYVPIVNDQGDLVYVYQYITDITTHRNFEKKIQSEAQNVNKLFEKSNAIIIGVDTRGYITLWNECASRVTGFKKNQVYAQKIIDVLLPEMGRLQFTAVVERVLLNESLNSFELLLRTSRGRLTTILLSATPRVNSLNEVVGAVFVGQDITELTAYRSSLEQKVEERTLALREALTKEKQLVEMRSRFVSIASHEFRSPLTSLQYETSYLQRELTSLRNPIVTTKLENIQKQVGHMLALLDDVLVYGKAETAKIRILLEPILLKDFFEELFEEVKLSTKCSHTIVAKLEELPEFFESDVKLLRNIFINLLTNAIKYSPGKKYVFFEAVQAEGSLQFIVKDEGIGISEDDKRRIFEPFSRGKGVDQIQGTGLGLSIVQRAIDLLQGAVHLRSEPSVGSTFTISLPYQTEVYG